MRRLRGLSFLLLAAFLAPGPVTGAAPTEDQSFLFIQSFDGGDAHHLVLTSGTGSRERVVTRRRALGRPAFSPDGRRIVFTGPVTDDSDGRYGLFLIDADGTRLVALTAPAFADFDPAWSPDGTWIAFVRDEEGTLDPDTCCRLALVRPDGSGRHTLPDTMGARYPAWSPDASRIAYQDPEGIWVMAPDGSARRRLASGSAVQQPAWSPDGSSIAYVRHLSGNRTGLMVVPAEGGAASVRVEVEGGIESPVWSMDGSEIYFVRYRGDGYDGRTHSAIWESTGPGEINSLITSTHQIHHLAHAPHWEPPFESPFDDVPADHPLAVEIAWLAAEGITRGCNPPANTLFCPDEPVTRNQMAAFLARALRLPPATEDHFIDDDGSVFEADIDRLAHARITRGCNPPRNDRYCPGDPVTRAQMASFLVRAFGLSEGGGTNRFVDDDGSVHEADIDRLGTAGVTRGCNPPRNDRYCPDDLVTRAQMAAFLYRSAR